MGRLVKPKKTAGAYRAGAVCPHQATCSPACCRGCGLAAQQPGRVDRRHRKHADQPQQLQQQGCVRRWGWLGCSAEWVGSGGTCLHTLGRLKKLAISRTACPPLPCAATHAECQAQCLKKSECVAWMHGIDDDWACTWALETCPNKARLCLCFRRDHLARPCPCMHSCWQRTIPTMAPRCAVGTPWLQMQPALPTPVMPLGAWTECTTKTSCAPAVPHTIPALLQPLKGCKRGYCLLFSAFYAVNEWQATDETGHPGGGRYKLTGRPGHVGEVTNLQGRWDDVHELATIKTVPHLQPPTL